MPLPPRALCLTRITLRVADLGAAVTFYRHTLGFALSSGGPAEDRAVLRLGGGELALARAQAGASPYPEPRAANDPWFQHFAVAVSDMDAAFARVLLSRAEPISRGGPQRLPPNTGSVTACKFRDPDGHPIELSHDPRRNGSPAEVSAAAPFLAIDHTALAVGDLEAALDFYTSVLGLTLSGRSLNQGPEQDRLDGLQGAKADVVALATTAPGPHLELLRYRSPPAQPPREIGLEDLAATRTTFEVEDLGRVTEALDARRWRWRAVGSGLATRDPDGHRLELQSASKYR